MPVTTVAKDGSKPPAKEWITGLILKLPALVIIGAIWFLSSQSTLPKPKGILSIDKVQHLIAYMVLAFTAGLWLSRERWLKRPWISLSLIAALASIYGIIDEVHQYFVPGRDCNVWDWAADTFGALLGAGAVLLVIRWFGRKRSPKAAAGNQTVDPV